MRLDIKPGALVQAGESVTIVTDAPCEIHIDHPSWAKRQEVLAEGKCSPDGFEWRPSSPGSYRVECRAGDEVLTRYVGVVEPGWAVCQLAVGAFTSDDFSEVLHPASVPVDYYVSLKQAHEPRWREFERRYGDAIHPHVQAHQMGIVDPSLAHDDSNWETLSRAEIVRRLSALREWWTGLGYQPLDRIASYTPCNTFVKACKDVGIRVLHSVVPEQNWSDGEWAINHWGMPTGPFWVAEDDFRKPGTRTPGGVLVMPMCHYQVLLSHLTYWCDFVLEPSHSLRWHRSVDSGQHPVRFEQLARDTLAMANRDTEHPLFFVAGIEFGRNIGVGKMREFNAKGIETLISLAADHPMVFATSRDVLKYYDRHIPTQPERVLCQRDTWAGARTMGKPGIADDAVVIERAGYKALILDGDALPSMHYDYLCNWDYPASATDVPEDWAKDDRNALRIANEGSTLLIEAESPLCRSIPVVAWDALIEDSPWPSRRVPQLDDGRCHTILEVPAGWSGTKRIALDSHNGHKSLSRPVWWQTKTMGEGERRRTYLHFDLPLLRDVEVPIDLLRSARVDGHQGSLGELSAGSVCLSLGPQKTWHRFWELDPEDIVPTKDTLDAVAALRPGLDLLSDSWDAERDSHIVRLHEACLCSQNWADEDLLLEIFCGADLPLGSRPRSAAFDIIPLAVDGLIAHEYRDGVLSYGPGKSFWCGARQLSVKVHNLDQARSTSPLVILLNSFDPLDLEASFHIVVSGQQIGSWVLPKDPFVPEAFYRIRLDPSWIGPDGTLEFLLICDQPNVIGDWWEDRGYVAGLHAIWVGIDR